MVLRSGKPIRHSLHIRAKCILGCLLRNCNEAIRRDMGLNTLQSVEIRQG